MVFRKVGEEKYFNLCMTFKLVSIYLSFNNILKYHSVSFYICYPINNLKTADYQLHMVIKLSRFRSVTLFGMELPHSLQMTIQLRILHLLIQYLRVWMGYND